MDQLRLVDQLYLLAHDPVGKPAVHETIIAAGLVGAAAIELLLQSRVMLSNGRLWVTDATPTGHPDNDATLVAIAQAPEQVPLRQSVAIMAETAYQRTRDRLAASGVLRATVHKRLFSTTTRYAVVDTETQRRCRTDLWYVVVSESPPLGGGALCALIKVLNLEQHVFGAMPFHYEPGRLALITARQAVPVRAVIEAVDGYLADRAVTINR